MNGVTGQDHDTIPGFRRQTVGQIDAAADTAVRRLLDDPTGRAAAGPAANAAQEAALRRIEKLRQAGRRRLRELNTFDHLASAGAAAIASISDVRVEDAPVWQTSAGTTITGSHTVTAPPPRDTLWSHTLRAVSPDASVASMPQPDLGDAVVDDANDPTVRWPDGWSVASTPRAAPATHDRDVTITQTKRPAPGTYDFKLTARNAGGPSTLDVIIVVPTT